MTTFLMLLVLCAPPVVQPSVETAPVPSTDDAADDPAIWVHPSNPERSLIIGTDKAFGLVVFALDGRIVQSLDVGPVNNVDVRRGVQLGGRVMDVACATHRGDQSIRVFEIGEAGELVPVASIATGLEPAYGACMYHDVAGNLFVFACDKEGIVEQYLLTAEDDAVSGVLVRRFDVGGQCEGLVADDDLGHLYVGEEEAAIWRYGAAPGAGSARAGVDIVGAGRVTADIEGLALYDAGDGEGYLIASSQGDDAFAVYRRDTGGFVGRFRIGAAAGIDGVTHTDGIDVTSASLGEGFPFGLFVCQDDENDVGTQNFKLVRWERIASAMVPPLIVNSHPGR